MKGQLPIPWNQSVRYNTQHRFGELSATRSPGCPKRLALDGRRELDVPARCTVLGTHALSWESSGSDQSDPDPEACEWKMPAKQTNSAAPSGYETAFRAMADALRGTLDAAGY